MPTVNTIDKTEFQMKIVFKRSRCWYLYILIFFTLSKFVLIHRELSVLMTQIVAINTPKCLKKPHLRAISYVVRLLSIKFSDMTYKCKQNLVLNV